MGKWAFEILGIYFFKSEKAPDNRIFSGALYATNAVPEKNEQESLPSGEAKK